MILWSDVCIESQYEHNHAIIGIWRLYVCSETIPAFMDQSAPDQKVPNPRELFQ